MHWPEITSDQLHAVREPLRWKLEFGRRSGVENVVAALRRAVLGPAADTWNPPSWLLPHQVEATQRIAASLRAFGGALLADAVGLGKTYMALAVSTRYRQTAAIVPASLTSQWRRVSSSLGVPVTLTSHEALSRGREVPAAELLIVDEAHRLRNPDTRRHDQLARNCSKAHLLLVSATPVVNRPHDIVHLLRLFLPDHALAILGVPSLDDALTAHAYQELAYAASSLVVARTARSLAAFLANVPRAVDSTVARPPPLPEAQLTQLLPLVDALQFPSVGDARAVALLRLHLFFRFASSVAACRETLRRHLAYLDRALAAAAQGEQLTRSAARFLFGPGDELQLELGVLSSNRNDPANPETLEQERDRILRLLTALPNSRHLNPKCDRLARLLRSRRGRKTIVFTTALATAMDLARRLEWREVAVVGAGRARIASGRISVETALSLFAPRARGASPPPRAAEVATLIATDLASEGLDLQDADGVVHYDLPWTPVRLVQRLGRIARLGSEHATARVWWFTPPRLLEDRLRIAARLEQKAESQLALGVTTTSVVGRARVLSEVFECRERLGGGVRAAGAGAAGAAEAAEAAEARRPCFLVVRGPLAAAIALRWELGASHVPELVVLQGTPLRPVRDYCAMENVLERLRRAPECSSPPPRALVACLMRLLRDRLATAQLGPRDPERQRLARLVMRHAYTAGRRRELGRVMLLDSVLDHITRGLRIGQERELAELLRGRLEDRQIRKWLSRQPRPVELVCGFQVEAALFGDGTVA